MLIKPEHLPMVRTLSMNDAHYESMMLINTLFSALENESVERINDILGELLSHTEEHFQDEEAMMMEKRFPPYLAHKEEHEDTLNRLRSEMAQFMETKDQSVLKNYLEDHLAPWFLRHTETMDAVTSMFLENSEVHLAFWERLKPRK